MKNLKHIAGLFLFVAFLMTSCNKDFLNTKPLSEFSGSDVWGDQNLAQAFVNQIYLGLDYDIKTHSDDADEGRSRVEGYAIEIGNCLITPDNADYWGHWNSSYSNIRACNIFLANVNSVKFDDADLKNRMTGEVVFLRAWYYFNLTSFFGGVPLITNVYGLTDDFLVPRATYADCIKFVVDECDKAASLLPVVETGDNNGRATKGAALALKARTLLIAASDLHNPQKNSIVTSGYSNPELLGYISGDATERWKAAKAAAKAVIDLGVYSLYKPDPANASEASQNYEDLFTSRTSVEDIQVRYFAASIGQGFDGWLLAPNGWYGDGLASPVNELVDAYEMSDGSQFSRNNPAQALEPYKNRDPRFYATILYEGAKYRPRPQDLTGADPIGVLQVGTWQKWDNTTNKMVEVYGLDSHNSVANTWNTSITGYNLLKYLDKTVDFKKTYQDLTWRYFRYGEILLNYAEACIELGEDVEARTYINMIRKRAGMPDVTESGAALRTRYRNERRIELAFEYQRFFDVRRWLIGSEAYHPCHGVTVLYPINPDHTTAIIPIITPVEVQLGAWDNKAYLFPISRSEMGKNNKLVQNPIYK